MGSDSASYAAYMLENSVSPPDSGIVCMCRMLASGGFSSHETSVCHLSPAMRAVFASACTGMISDHCSRGFPRTDGMHVQLAETPAKSKMLFGLKS